MGRGASHEGNGAQLGAGVDAGIRRVEIACGHCVIADERGDVDEAGAIDVDDDHVVEDRDTGPGADLRLQVGRHRRKIDRGPRGR